MILHALGIVATGFVVGAMVGISGVGGAALMTPLLILVFRVNPLVAIGTDLLYNVPTKLAGAIVHVRQGTVDRGIFSGLLTGGVPGVVLGLVALVYVRHAFDVKVIASFAKHAVAIALILSSVAMAIPLLRRTRAVDESKMPQTSVPRWKLVCVGAVVGFVVTLTSIGSGSLTLPLLYASWPALGLRKLVGSDVAFAAALIPLAATGHFALGDVDVKLAALLVLGSVPGAIIGSRLCKTLPEHLLRPVVAGTLIVVASRLV
jgi:uncharacterized membrane protein YfcA